MTFHRFLPLLNHRMSAEEELEKLKQELEARMQEILKQNPSSQRLKEILGVDDASVTEDEPQPG